ncbi:LOW QUALITY PROTEIN: probable xyloglucan galactosyltransferase GT17 [Mangifera indica]|uniref:LOW QUALITY PROTEIN: probable xyloglucan galactosyltransferase GT17 n=1 Tax=Mangifera indica TaxID=29780 RepID=UPI001CF978B5|nr:LOW QUALITY PROTEIN: probable xyloglucan galactosyltransferase GT17 [Mangifera indica]
MTEKDKKPYSKTKETQPNSRFYNYTLFIFISLTAWFLLLFLYLPPAIPTNSKQQNTYGLHNIDNYNQTPFSVYIYNLHPQFNFKLLKNCSHLNIYSNMCPHVANRGLGQPLPDIATELGLGGAWFATHQFLAEMIFHARMENHPFRTWDPSRATLFYVPFYGGLHASSKFREANFTVRDELAVELEEFLRSQPWWERHQGKDHFMVLGRTAWDFMRTPGGTDFGANCLLNLPRIRNMSVMTVERHPWKGLNQYGIPYPSYFHPSRSQQMLTWQQKIRQVKRPHLFTFIGARRKGVEEKAAMRNELIRQCGESTHCNLMPASSQGSSTCYKPSEVIKAMSSSDFCLQAPGDSFTRRSTFDAVLAGCIPVFFSPHTAYTQYTWFLPADGEENSYSVYIDGEKGNMSIKIEEELMKIPRERVEMLRNKVIDLIPRVTYKHPNASDDEAEFEDAVDVTIAALAKKVQKIIQ